METFSFHDFVKEKTIHLSVEISFQPCEVLKKYFANISGRIIEISSKSLFIGSHSYIGTRNS